MVNENNKKHSIYNWLISLALNTVILLVIISCTDMMYETNDDFGISAKIAADYPYIGFVNYFLCKFLIAIQNVIPNINIFMASQIVFSFIAFTVVIKVLLDRCSNMVLIIFAAAVMSLYALDHYCAIQFTKTSAVLLVAGLVLLIDNYLNDRKIGYFVLGYLLFYVGVMYRQKGMFPALAFATVVLLLYLILNRYTGENKQSIKLKDICVLGLFMALALIPYGVDILSDNYNASTPALKYAREYQAERVKITDYPVYDYYEDNKEEYDAIGLDENDIYLVTHWMLDYDGAASLDNLKKINEINADSIADSRSVTGAVNKFVHKTVKDIRTLGFKGIHIIILALISLCILVLTKPKNCLYIIAIGGLTILMYIAIYYMQRPQYRAFYIADLSAAVWLLYILAMEMDEKSNIKSGIAGLLCTMITVSMMFVAVPSLNRQYESLCTKIESNDAVSFYQENDDRFYVCATSSKKRHPSYLNPLNMPVVERNATGMGGWGTLSPYELDQLKEYGLNNLVSDMIDSDNTFFLGTGNRKRIEKYLNKWYNDGKSYIDFKQVELFEKTPIYQVVRVYGESDIA